MTTVLAIQKDCLKIETHFYKSRQVFWRGFRCVAYDWLFLSGIFDQSDYFWTVVLCLYNTSGGLIFSTYRTSQASVHISSSFSFCLRLFFLYFVNKLIQSLYCFLS